MPRFVAIQSSKLTQRDAVAIATMVVFSVGAQVVAAVYFEARGSLLALGGSALVFLSWVTLRFRGV